MSRKVTKNMDTIKIPLLSHQGNRIKIIDLTDDQIYR